MQLDSLTDWNGWLKKTRRSAKKAKVKDADSRFFAVVKLPEEGQCLTWKKDDKPEKITEGDHFHRVSEMTVICTDDDGVYSQHCRRCHCVFA